MEIKQKKHSTRVRYAFGAEELEYCVEDGAGSRSFSVPYTQISRDRQTLVERNAWLRNVGLLWMALGAGLTALSLAGDAGLKISIWLWVGLACYGVYRVRVTRFTLVPTERGNLLVIDDADGERILGEIDAHRVACLRREFDFVPEHETSEQHRGRFRWLHRQGALSDAELEQRLADIDALDASRGAPASPQPGMRLN